MPLQIRRGTQQDRDDLVTNSTPLAIGEPLFTTDEGNLYVGDGTTPGGVHVNVPPTFDFEEYTGQIGELEKDPIGDPGVKSPFITLDGVSVTIDLDGQISSNITPNFNELFDLGEPNFRFKEIYLKGGTSTPNSGGLNLSGARITSNGTVVELPVNSTAGGSKILTETLNNPSIYATIINGDDAVILDAEAGEFFGSVRSINNAVLVDGIAETIVCDVDNTTINTTTLTSPEINSKNIRLAPDEVNGQTGITIITTENDLVDYTLFGIFGFHESASAGTASKYLRGRGTPEAGSTVATGDIIHECRFISITGANTFEDSVKISVQVDPAGTVNATQAPGKVVISTQNNSGVMTEGLTIDMNSVVGLNSNQALVAGVGSGQVNVGGGVVSYVKIKVGATIYAMPLYAINL
jgi:hypothetical protein